ncbi:MAG: DEAD/DEAH box helicase [Rhodospirillaceae bacterium]|nr:DEAD/DEAH box helicase [Rhodospirillaceae bacterium]
MKQFNELGLAEPLLRAVAAEGYTTPTPIQADVIPAMLAGRDVVGIAQTGTGKTASFVLPLLHRLGHSKTITAPHTCGALILAPTRELAAQIAANIRTYGRFQRPSVAVVVGGVRPAPQVKALAAGADIVVATPGRLLDHMTAGVLRLDRTTAVVLDEADHMLDLGFIPAIRRIMAKLPKVRQTVMMSATMPPAIRSLAQDFLSDPQEIAVAAAARPIERIVQSVLHTDSASKRGVLTDLMSAPDMERAIVFTRTKHGADKVNQHLQRAGLSSDAIHGNKSQSQRERALAAFRSGQTAILVATDIAARGIDVDDVSHVVNYELPNVPEAYVHRIGRTARAGRGGIAISLCDPAERGLLRDIERLVGARLDSIGVAAAATAGIESPAAAAAEPVGRRAADHPTAPRRRRRRSGPPAGSAHPNSRTGGRDHRVAKGEQRPGR